MTHYRELYEAVEDSGIHAIVEEVRAAENQAQRLLKGIEDYELRNAIDSAFGAIARAYEIQGFNMGLAAATHTMEVVA